MVRLAHAPEALLSDVARPIGDSFAPYCLRERPIDFFDATEASDHGHEALDENGDRVFNGPNLVRRPAVPADPKIEASGRLARKLAWRQVRKFFRSDLRDRHKSDFTMDYYRYLEERDDIGRLGRDDGLTGEDFELQKTRQSVLGSADEATVEREVTLIDWGPLRLNDSGQVRVDVSKLRNEPTTQTLTIAPEIDPDQPVGDSLFQGRWFRLKTDLKLRPDVGAVVDGEGYRAVLGDVGAGVRVDFFSAILGERYLSAELETSFDEDGQTGLFVNFTLYAR